MIIQCIGLFACIEQYITDELLAQLAETSALSIADARATITAAVPILVQQLTQPTDFDELNARWAMCRQLYLSQLLTQPEELLRTDLGWPERRQLLAQRLLGSDQLTALANLTGSPVHAEVMLGYLTVIALAAVGEQADAAGLTPTDLGQWLARQHALEKPPTATTARSTNVVKVSVLGSVAIASLLGGYYWLSNFPETPSPTASQVAKVASVTSTPVAVPVVGAVASVTAPVVPAEAVAAVKAPPVATATKLAAPVVVAATGRRDTVMSAAPPRSVGEKPISSEGHSSKVDDQSLTLTLPNETTLTVGFNSAENLLYKRLINPDLLQPTDIAIDRLRFGLSQTQLGAEGTQQLGNLASILQAFPKVRLIVVGHANIREAQAIRLGLQRASLAVDELVKQGIAADRLQAQDMLATEQLSKNDSVEKQAMLQGITLKLSRL